MGTYLSIAIKYLFCLDISQLSVLRISCPRCKLGASWEASRCQPWDLGSKTRVAEGESVKIRIRMPFFLILVIIVDYCDQDMGYKKCECEDIIPQWIQCNLNDYIYVSSKKTFWVIRSTILFPGKDGISPASVANSACNAPPDGVQQLDNDEMVDAWYIIKCTYIYLYM